MDQRFATLRDSHVPETIVWYLVAFVGFIGAAIANERQPYSRAVLWAVAIGARVALLFTTPTLSDDVYRYLWDGHLVASGVNPYRFAIADPAGDPYEIAARALANNPDLSSPYLPVANLVFAALALVTPAMSLAVQVTVLQAAMVVLDLVTAALLAIALRLAGLPRHRLLLWLWNPLVIVEIAHGAHLDALMLVLFADGLIAQLRSPMEAGAPALTALATLTRPVPGFAAIALLPLWSWRQRGIYVGTLVAFCVPFGLAAGFGLESPPTGTGLFGSARVYSDTFRFNSALYQSLEARLSDPQLVQGLAAVAFAGIAVFTLWRAWQRREADGLSAVRLIAVPVVGYVVLTPVFHPWYLLIIVLLAIFWTPTGEESAYRWLHLVPLGWLAATVVFSYLTYLDPNAHAELTWVRRLQWWPTLALAVIAAGVWHSRRGRERVAA